MSSDASPVAASRLPRSADLSLERPWILLEVTRRCDRHCLYCYAGGSQPGRELTRLGLDAILDRLLPQVVPRGVTLIGGEPLLNSELDSLARGLCERQLSVSLSTNAQTLNRNRIRELVLAGVRAFEVSFDSIDQGVYSQLTRSRAPTLQRTVAELVHTGVAVTVGVMLTRLNLQQLEDLLRLCYALGVRRVSLNQMALVGTAREHPELVPTDNELLLALDQANTIAATLGLHVAVGLPLEPCRVPASRLPALQFERCGCGNRKWLLEPSGDVRTCELSTQSIGNLFCSTWHELVQSDAANEFREHRPAACLACHHWDSCHGGCRLRAPLGEPRTASRTAWAGE